MKTALREAMTAGVYVEFRDAAGNTIGQALYTDWRGRPVPAVGDMLACDVQAIAGPAVRKLLGRVASRQFEVQREADGSPAVWVRLIVETKAGAPRPTTAPRAATFSRN
jgi:hypothetical protein